METSAFKSVVNKVTLIDDTAWNDFEQYFSKRTLRKNELLWAAGDVCRHLVFINYGIIRSFRYANAKEVSNQFFLEDSIFYDDVSFVSQKPCVNSYDALEETEIIVIPRVAVNLMYDKYKSFERLGRLILEHNHILLVEAQQNSKNQSSDEKYRQLMLEHPNILQRVPLKYIASYLNMTPEYLSKIRKGVCF